MTKLIKVALVSAALSTSGLALAQTTPSQEPMKPAPSAVPERVTPGSGAVDAPWYSAQTGELRASKLIGMSVKNAAGETVGDVNDVVLGKDGRVAAVVIGVGGFLGIGERQVAVRFDSLQLTTGTDQRTTATLNATKDALKTAPEWKWSAQDRSSPTGTGTKPTQ